MPDQMETRPAWSTRYFRALGKNNDSEENVEQQTTRNQSNSIIYKYRWELALLGESLVCSCSSRNSSGPKPDHIPSGGHPASPVPSLRLGLPVAGQNRVVYNSTGHD